MAFDIDAPAARAPVMLRRLRLQLWRSTAATLFD